ncbi:von Willebrand factor-like [Glandiceps talaboti]
MQTKRVFNMTRKLLAVLLVLVTMSYYGMANSIYNEEPEVKHEIIKKSSDRQERDVTYIDRVIYCDSVVGGTCLDVCGPEHVRRNAYCKKGQFCCVVESCDNCTSGGCFKTGTIGLIETPSPTCSKDCPAGRICGWRSCERCGGDCYTECPAGFRELHFTHEYVCPCVDEGMKCCEPIFDCETKVTGATCKAECAENERQVSELQLFAGIITLGCYNNFKCCLPEHDTSCEATYPGRGVCLEGGCLSWMIEKSGLCTGGCVCCVAKLPPGPGRGEPGTGVGDPWYTTFDGYRYNFMGRSYCSYTLFQPCNSEAEYSVSVYLTPGKNVQGKPAEFISGMTVEYRGHRVELHYGDILVDGKELSSDYDLPFNITEQFSIPRVFQGRLEVTLDSKFMIRWNKVGSIHAELHESQHGQVCGLLGNADGDDENDLLLHPYTTQLKFGETTLKDDIEAFGESWLVPGSC